MKREFSADRVERWVELSGPAPAPFDREIRGLTKVLRT